jgi:hypothetical protein
MSVERATLDRREPAQARRVLIEAKADLARRGRALAEARHRASQVANDVQRRAREVELDVQAGDLRREADALELAIRGFNDRNSADPI